MVGAKCSWRMAAAACSVCQGAAGRVVVLCGRTGSARQCSLCFLCSPSARPVGGPGLGENWTGGICSLFGTRCWASCSFLPGLYWGPCAEPPGMGLPLSQRTDFMVQAVQFPTDPYRCISTCAYLQHPGPASHIQRQVLLPDMQHHGLGRSFGNLQQNNPHVYWCTSSPITKLLGATLLNVCHHCPGRERLVLCSLAEMFRD